MNLYECMPILCPQRTRKRRFATEALRRYFAIIVKNNWCLTVSHKLEEKRLKQSVCHLAFLIQRDM
jgi:hypothetical protein